MKSNKILINKIIYLLICASFGIIGPLVKAISLPSPAKACYRAWIASLALLIFLLISGKIKDKMDFKKEIAPMLISGAFIGICWIGLFEGYALTTVAKSTLFYNLSPMIVFILTPFILKEKFTLRHILCAVASVMGMVLVSGALEESAVAAKELKGIAYASCGAIFYAGVVLINKRFPKGNPVNRTFWQLLAAALTVTPYLALQYKPAELVPTKNDILLLLVLGVLLTAVTYILYFNTMVKIPARTVSIFTYADPVVACFVSIFWMHEGMSALSVAGAAVIIAASILSELDFRHSEKKEEKNFQHISPLVSAIEELLKGEEQALIVAIDGRCASGKTTVAAELEKKYDCNVFHLDDYFLQPHQRTEERLSVAGGNVDYERFRDEILLPLSQNKAVTYRKFSCKNMCLEEPITLEHKRLNIVEGSYSLHPELSKYFSLKVFSDIDEALQRKRIAQRNPEKAEIFLAKWIPLEEKYFNELKIREKSDIVIKQK